jgi:hypothetical protein
LELGELGDWGNLNEAISHSNKLIEILQHEMATSQTAMADAQSPVDGLGQELTRYRQLKNDLNGFGPVLQSKLHDMTALAESIRDIENTVSDISVCLS